MLLRQFEKVIGNLWQIIHRTLKLSGFNLVVSQASVIFPFIIQAARYFSGQIKLGDLIQTSQAFSKVQSALSFYRNSYDDFAAYRAVLDRLTGFHSAIEATKQPSKTQIEPHMSAVIFDNLNINTPEGNALIKRLDLTIEQGSSLLIQGKSGVGKTTLLRTVAGLWPYSEGRIFVHNKHCF